MKKELREFIGEKIGEASECWSEAPKGAFDIIRACKIVDEIMDKITEHELVFGARVLEFLNGEEE